MQSVLCEMFAFPFEMNFTLEVKTFLILYIYHKLLKTTSFIVANLYFKVFCNIILVLGKSKLVIINI